MRKDWEESQRDLDRRWRRRKAMRVSAVLTVAVLALWPLASDFLAIRHVLGILGLAGITIHLSLHWLSESWAPVPEDQRPGWELSPLAPAGIRFAHNAMRVFIAVSIFGLLLLVLPGLAGTGLTMVGAR